MPKNFLTTAQLLAAYWLDGQHQSTNKLTVSERLTSFVEERQFNVTEVTVAEAEKHLQSRLVKGDVEGWIVLISFMAHPHAIWDFMLDALTFAETEDHLWQIATGLAQPLLAHYGSMMPHFEARASKDPKFARMLTGVWRHRICDDVWMRLRALQTTVAVPLNCMIPLEKGIDYMAEHLKPEDRNTPDKGLYSRDTKGNWIKKSC